MLKATMTAAIALVLTATAPAEDYMPLKEGNSWTYSLPNGTEVTMKVAGSEEVKGVKCARVEGEIAGQGKSASWFAADADGIRMYKFKGPQAEIEFGKPPLQIKLPFKQGDKWQARLPLEQPVDSEMESAGKETIKVPAGTFECIRINTVVTMGNNKIVSSTWYADGVGQVQLTMSGGGQEITMQLTKTNVAPAKGPVAGPDTPRPGGDRVCPACGAKAPADARFCPSCGAKVPPPAVAAPTMVRPTVCPKCGAKLTAEAKFCTGCGAKVELVPASPTSAPAMEKYESKDGRLMLFRPRGWKVEDGEMFGAGTFGVTVMDPTENGGVLFITAQVKETVKDSAQMAVEMLAGLQKAFADLKVADMKTTADKNRTQARISMTAEGKKLTGHAYFFYSPRASSVYVLMAREDLWEQLCPTLTAISANLAFAPEGVTKVLQQAQKVAQAGPEVAAGRALSPLALLQAAEKQQGKNLPLKGGKAADGAFSIRIPDGWTIESSGLNYAVYNEPRAKEYGMIYTRAAFSSMNVGQPIPGVTYSPYLPPAQATAYLMQLGKIGKDMKVLAEVPGDQLPADLTAAYKPMEVNGNRVDLRALHVQFTNAVSGKQERGVYLVASIATPMLYGWECWLAGNYAPADELEEYLPLFGRISKSIQADPQWLQGVQNAQAAETQRLQGNLRNSIAESQKSFERYIESGREASRSRDYTSWAYSQSTLGQGSWVAENEGAKVYNTDSWGIQGPEGRADAPRYNNTNFTGTTPWGQNTNLVNTRDQWEKYIATPRN